MLRTHHREIVSIDELNAQERAALSQELFRLNQRIFAGVELKEFERLSCHETKEVPPLPSLSRRFSPYMNTVDGVGHEIRIQNRARIGAPNQCLSSSLAAVS